MSDNETKKLYPEQENPPRPTYEAVLRGHNIGGWLYYHPTNGNPDNGTINIVIKVDGQPAHAEDFLFTSADERKVARAKAKNVWQQVVVQALARI
jgi:hypothetical protein